MNFKNYLEESATEIDKKLEDCLSKEIDESRKISEKLTHLVTLFADQSRGGKRLRGALVRLGFELVSGEFKEEIYQASLAYEVVQTSLIAHDDIIDRSPLRRGKPTLYQSLGGDHYGISQTICLGDTGFFLSFRLIANSNFSDDKKLKAIEVFNESMLKTAAGEMLDVEIPFRGENFTEDEVIAISHLKTAHYTIIGPLQLGASLAGADESYLEDIEEFGKNLGIAFQIQDDILGVFGEEEIIGKSITSDVEEGKVTLLIAYALKKATKEQEDILKEHYGRGEIAQKDFEKVKKVLEETGALDETHKKALEYVAKAKLLIPRLTADQKMQDLLNELADFLVLRKK